MSILKFKEGFIIFSPQNLCAMTNSHTIVGQGIGGDDDEVARLRVSGKLVGWWYGP